MVTFENEINTQLVLIINMDAIDSTGYIVNCMNRMHIHINNNDRKSCFVSPIRRISNAYSKFDGCTAILSKNLLKFGFLRKLHKQHILKGQIVL